MQDKRAVTTFRRKAPEVRTIAQGLFDKSERQTVLQFVDDREKLAVETARAGKQP